MKRVAVVLAITLLASSFGAVAIGASDTPAAEKKPVQTGKKPSVKKERTTHITATVEAIDLENRVVTLKGPKGDLFDVIAGPQVKNLPQVKAGDQVNITYYQSIAVRVFKPGEAPQGAASAAGAERLAKPGEKPSGIAGANVTITATVESISPNKTSVTLKMADGKYKVVKIKEKKNLDNVSVGDEVVITATETLAVSVKPAAKK
jgi:ribosomal 50S subunit-recycling heat shock protein